MKSVIAAVVAVQIQAVAVDRIPAVVAAVRAQAADQAPTAAGIRVIALVAAQAADIPRAAAQAVVRARLLIATPMTSVLAQSANSSVNRLNRILSIISFTSLNKPRKQGPFRCLNSRLRADLGPCRLVCRMRRWSALLW